MSQKSDLKSPRRAARERIAPEVERLTGEIAPALPAAPNKVEQLEALVKAGRVGDPLVGVATSAPDEAPGFRARGQEPAPRNDKEISLLDRVRYLYEQTVVPVREIARLVRVTERTLYKCVARYGWQRRHGTKATQARGAGGRFLSFEERGTSQPHVVACGPKALDPLAAEAAGGSCERAAIASNLALSEVIAAARIEQAERVAGRVDQACARTLTDVARTVRQLARAAQKQMRKG